MSAIDDAILALVRHEIALALNERDAAPERVSQRTVERWTSVPARVYLAAVRRGEIEASKVRRLVFAETRAVVAWVDTHRVEATKGFRDPKLAEFAEALASVGGRIVEDDVLEAAQKRAARIAKKRGKR
jgi:hypothetical protein